MEKGTGIVRITFAVILSSLLFISANAQKKEKLPIWEVRKGCLSFQGNLAPGYLFFEAATHRPIRWSYAGYWPCKGWLL